MAAFDKINSGFPQMDEILDYIVWETMLYGRCPILKNSVISPGLLPGRRCPTAGM